MFQDDIFKLLLGCLLIANESGGCGENFGKLNEIIIMSLLINSSCCRPKRCCPPSDNCGNAIEPLNNSNTGNCNCGCGCGQ